MTRLEKFFFGSAILGLLVDLIALVTFISGIWTIGSSAAIGREEKANTLFFTLTGLFIVFCWLVLTWLLARRGLNNISEDDKRAKALGNIVLTSTMGLLVCIAPLTWLWFAATLMNGADPETPGLGAAIAIFAVMFTPMLALLAFPMASGIGWLMQLFYADLMSLEEFLDESE